MSGGGMPAMPDSLGGSLIGGVLKGAGDIFSGFESAAADREEAAYYKKAAAWTKYSTGIKELMFNRQLTQTLGTARSDIGANGLRLSGSAADVMRSSAQAGAFTRQQIGLQGEIDEQGLLAQAGAAEHQAQGAEIGGLLGGLGQIIGGA